MSCMFFEIFIYMSNTETTVTSAANAAAEVAPEVRIAELQSNISKRQKVLTLLESMPEGDRDAASEAEAKKAIDKMESEIAKIQFAAISAQVTEQAENIAEGLQTEMSSIMKLGESQACVVNITLFGKVGENGKGYSVKVSLKDSSPDAVKSVSKDGEEGSKRGTEIVYGGQTYGSAQKAAEAWHQANGRTFSTTPKNWLAWVKAHAAEYGFTYPDGSVPTK